MNDPISTDPDSQSGLAGQTVLVTRPVGQAVVLVEKIEALGGRPIVCPVIKIEPQESIEPLTTAIGQLSGYAVVVFASRNGVDFFGQQLERLSARIPAGLKIAAIGSSTAELIRQKWGIQAVMPQRSNSQGLAEYLVRTFPSGKMLLVRGDRGSDVLASELSAAKIEFDSVVAYRSTDVQRIEDEVVNLFMAGRIDWVTATSSSIGRSAVRLFGDWLASGEGGCGTKKAKLVSISPTTTAAIRLAGGEPAAEATVYNLDGLIAAMLQAGR